jgi:hypothetical protein
VAQTCDPSYLEVEIKRITVWGQSWQKLQRSYLNQQKLGTVLSQLFGEP